MQHVQLNLPNNHEPLNNDTNYEQIFIGSTDTSKITSGYQALKANLNDPSFIKKLDKNLLALFVESKNTNVCRMLAENYKEQANSSSFPDDYIKAAFWFRMLYVSGAHSSYLDEYNSIVEKSGLKK